MSDDSSCKTKYVFVCIYLISMLPHLSLSLGKFRYIRDSTGGMSQCVGDIVSATGNVNCAHQAGTRGSYAYVYVAENKTCHICRHSREIGNRSLEHLPISQYPVYQRGISQCSYLTRRNIILCLSYFETRLVLLMIKELWSVLARIVSFSLL